MSHFGVIINEIRIYYDWMGILDDDAYFDSFMIKTYVIWLVLSPIYKHRWCISKRMNPTLIAFYEHQKYNWWNAEQSSNASYTNYYLLA